MMVPQMLSNGFIDCLLLPGPETAARAAGLSDGSYRQAGRMASTSLVQREAGLNGGVDSNEKGSLKGRGSGSSEDGSWSRQTERVVTLGQARAFAEGNESVDLGGAGRRCAWEFIGRALGRWRSGFQVLNHGIEGVPHSSHGVDEPLPSPGPALVLGDPDIIREVE